MKRLAIVSGSLCVGLAVSYVVWDATTAFTANADERDPLSFVPAEASIVVGVNPPEMRGTSTWKSLKSAIQEVAGTRLADVSKECGFDPLDQADSVVVALPKALRGSNNEFVAVVKGRFDLERLGTCARSSAGKAGQSVAESRVGKHAVMAFGDDGPRVSCVGDSTCIVASAAWMPKALALVDETAGAPDITTNPVTAALLRDADRNGGLWWVGEAPQVMNDSWKAEGNPLASIKTAHGSLKLGHGLAGRLAFGLAGDDDAKHMATAATAELSNLARAPEAQRVGLARYLGPSHLAFAAAGSEVTVQVRFTPQELDGLGASFKGFLTSAMAAGPMGAGEASQALNSPPTVAH